MSATIISITTHRRYEKGSKRGRQRVFTMGYHTYSGGQVAVGVVIIGSRKQIKERHENSMSLLSQHLVTSIDSIMGLIPQSILEITSSQWILS